MFVQPWSPLKVLPWTIYWDGKLSDYYTFFLNFNSEWGSCFFLMIFFIQLCSLLWYVRYGWLGVKCQVTIKRSFIVILKYSKLTHAHTHTHARTNQDKHTHVGEHAAHSNARTHALMHDHSSTFFFSLNLRQRTVTENHHYYSLNSTNTSAAVAAD